MRLLRALGLAGAMLLCLVGDGRLGFAGKARVVTIPPPARPAPDWYEPSYAMGGMIYWRTDVLARSGDRVLIVQEINLPDAPPAAFLAFDRRGGFLGQVAAPAETVWVGFGAGESIYAATRDGRLHCARRLGSAFLPVGQVPGATVWASSSAQVVALTSDHVYLSRDGGATFQASTPDTAVSLLFLSLRDDGAIAVSGDVADWPRQRWFLSEDHGATWQPVTSASWPPRPDVETPFWTPLAVPAVRPTAFPLPATPAAGATRPAPAGGRWKQQLPPPGCLARCLVWFQRDPFADPGPTRFGFVGDAAVRIEMLGSRYTAMPLPADCSPLSLLQGPGLGVLICRDGRLYTIGKQGDWRAEATLDPAPTELDPQVAWAADGTLVLFGNRIWLRAPLALGAPDAWHAIDPQPDDVAYRAIDGGRLLVAALPTGAATDDHVDLLLDDGQHRTALASGIRVTARLGELVIDTRRRVMITLDVRVPGKPNQSGFVPSLVRGNKIVPLP